MSSRKSIKKSEELSSSFNRDWPENQIPAYKNLLMLQARFQQRQLQEKEQKLLQLYDQQQQRAHQVAQRGSAGSSGSNSSSNTITNPGGKVRQMFDERRQNKGIDKSYPLDPLDAKSRKNTIAGQSKVTNRRSNVNAKRTTSKAEHINSKAGTINRTILSNSTDSISKESDASYLPFDEDSISQRENLSRESYEYSRRDYDKPITQNTSFRQLNGHLDTTQTYEINIDDVIDNEAMERNRMLAKFHSTDLEKRVRANIENEEFFDETLVDSASDKVLEKPNERAAKTTRKSSLVETKGDQIKNNNAKKNNNAPASTTTTAKSKTVPASTNSNSSKNFEADSSSKKAAESIVRKNVSPYPSSKSPDRNEKVNTNLTSASRTSSVLTSNSSTPNNRNQASPASRTNKTSKSNAPTPTAAQRSSASSAKTDFADDSLSTCKVCNRRFASERIGLHEQICAKTSQKKRKMFDTATHRIRGTEIEPFVQKPMHKNQSKASVKKSEPEPRKSNWRRKHEDFINAIRSAKQMQVHLAAGGKLSDLPPPPPIDTSDYIQCPHCSRKFNQGAAERHIPKCGNMQHNKRPAPSRSRR